MILVSLAPLGLIFGLDGVQRDLHEVVERPRGHQPDGGGSAVHGHSLEWYLLMNLL